MVSGSILVAGEVLGIVAVAFMVGFEGVDSLTVLAETFFSGINSFALVSLPMFILMGTFAYASGISRRQTVIVLMTTTKIGSKRALPSNIIL